LIDCVHYLTSKKFKFVKVIQKKNSILFLGTQCNLFCRKKRWTDVQNSFKKSAEI